MRALITAMLLCGAAAHAGENDLQLWKLGHPDCIGCDAAGNGGEKGDPGAQARFHRLASTLGLAFAPAFQEPAGTLGQAGFEVGVSASEAFLRIPADAWATSGGAPPSVLTIPTVTLRKGLGGSLELGASAAWLDQSQMVALSLALRWAILDGIASAPDLALRVWATRVVGTQELDLASGGADLQLSKSFAAFGMLKLQPYGTFGMAAVNALSNVVDFKPAAENPRNPTADDGLFRLIAFWENRYLRSSVGLRLVTGAVVLGVEGSVAWGTNAIQHDPLAGGTPQNYLRLWNGAARLGFVF